MWKHIADKLREILDELKPLLGPVMCLALLVVLTGCGAPLADVTATGTAAATLITEALPTYETANAADAKQAAANAAVLLADCQTAIADAQAMPSTTQIEEDAAAVLQIIGEIMSVLNPFLGDVHPAMAPAMQASKVTALNAQCANWRARLAVIRGHQKK
jgi:hypothetical protein